MRNRIHKQAFRALAAAGALTAFAAVPAAGASELSAGGYHALRVSEGFVIGQGDGTYGQLGENPQGSPAIVAGLGGAIRVAAGGFSTLALMPDGTVRFLGETTLQHTTPHGTPNPVFAPEQVPGLAGIDRIAAGHRHYLALDADSGELYAWGHNGSGQVGNGGLRDVSTPALVLTDVVAMTAGDGFSLAVKSDQTLWAWGRNAHGQLGLGDTADRLVPTRVPDVTTAAAVAAGGQHALILLADGTVLATGNNEFGQLGLGTTTPATTPMVVPDLDGVESVCAGYFHSAAMGADNQIRLWGRNFEGQCGGGESSPGTHTTPRIPAKLPGRLPGAPVAIACGYHFTLVQLDDGSIWGTGSNADGVFDGSSVADQDSSRNVLSPQPASLLLDIDDSSPPRIESLGPANGGTGASVNTELVIGFQEAVLKGTGHIIVRENPGNQVVSSIDVASPEVAINSREATITLPGALAHGSLYYVEIDAGAFTDLAGRDFGGIAGSTTWGFATAVAPAPGAPIARYTFDIEEDGTTPDSVGSAFATLGGGVSINNSVEGMIGTGVLEMTHADGSGLAAVDGAVTSNSFDWSANGARTITFWWRAKTPNVDTSNGAFVSFGDTSANGTRFDIKEHGSGTALRVEVQGHGWNTNPADFDDGNWHFVAVTVPDIARFRDIAWFAGVRGGTLGGNLNTSTNTLAVNTGTGPLVFGDSIIIGGSTNDNRTPNGYLDDFQLYDRVLTREEILLLYNQPGNTFTGAGANFDSFISDPAFGIAPANQGFGDDPDGDGIPNGVEAWFGTHPGESNAGLVVTATDGLVTTLSHPQNENPPSDVAGYYEWSPDLAEWYAGDGVDGPPGGPTLDIIPQTLGATTTVTATASEPMERLFLRVGARLLPVD